MKKTASEVTESVRRRINVTRGMTGNISFETTVETEGYTLEETLTMSDELVKALTERYPHKEAGK